MANIKPSSLYRCYFGGIFHANLICLTITCQGPEIEPNYKFELDGKVLAEEVTAVDAIKSLLTNCTVDFKDGTLIGPRSSGCSEYLGN